LPKYREDSRSGILLTGDVASMHRLVKEAGVRDVNIGGIHHRPDRRQKLRYVFLSPVEEEVLREMERDGATVTARDVPSANAVELQAVLSNEEAAR
jgi:mannose/fructose/N-acetylgalactosamine-specific phosphotransferase system component IIB